MEITTHWFAQRLQKISDESINRYIKRSLELWEPMTEEEKALVDENYHISRGEFL